MKGRRHRKQILLFLIAVFLPSLVLVFLTVRMIGQEKELSQKRLSEEKVRKAQEIGQNLLVKLESIKLQEASASPGEESFPARVAYVNPEVVFIGRVQGRSLSLPWENNRSLETAKKRLNSPEFSRNIRLGEQEEFNRNNLDQAARLYDQTMTAAKHPVQTEYARLLLARVLAKADKKTDAVANYKKLLGLPFDLTDELGIPFSLYAASRLLDIDADCDGVLYRCQSESSEFRWLTPEAAHLLRDLMENIGGHSPDAAIKQGAADILESLHEYLHIINRVQSLQNDYSALGLTVNPGVNGDNHRPLWISYNNAWLVSLASGISDRPGLLVAVDIGKLFVSLRADRDFIQTFPADFQPITGDDPEGLSIGSNFRGLKIAFLGDQESWFSEPWIVQPAFYLIALLLILGITLFGAYILWRDIRRDVRMAEMRSQFVSSVSHELKTPLTSIRMFAETLRLGRSKDKKAQEEYLDTIVNESQRLTRLLNNVLDFSKIEQGKRTYRLEPASLEGIIQSVARTMEYPLGQQGFKIDVSVEKDIPDVPVDRDAMEQALLNLLHNAMKYSGESREIGLDLFKKAGYAVMQVIDHGIGIPPQEQKKIFEKFYRGSSSENERIAGTGLGLALVLHIVQSHGGKLELESEPGKGSTFSIVLPLESKQ
jgi:signal transduction histidine kinase